MHKIRFLLILLLLPFSLLAQQKTKIILQDSRRGTTDGVNNISYLKNPVFRHENATLSCDSAVYYENRNVFEAFKNVHIIQGDTINIYSDHLTYDGNTKIAHLTENVRMYHKDDLLTTNILDYHMGIKVGTYIDGGKIVNKDVTLTSKSGRYFSGTRDAFFRYNVVVVTSSQVVIKSDTLRYNTLSNWAYFYGPTNIKSKDDNLYTENGAYNTKTEYAYFGKKNLYTSGSKSLKGDSLYYDGIAGYGKAVKNIIFKDTTDKTVLYGQLGYYYKSDARAVATKNAYIGLGTGDSVMVNKKLRPDTLWMGADTLQTQMVLQKTLKLIESPVLKKDNELGEEDKPEKKGAAKTGFPEAKAPPTSAKSEKHSKKELAKLAKEAAAKNMLPPSVKDSLLKTVLAKDSLLKDSLPVKKPDIPIIADSLKTKLSTLIKQDSLLKKGEKLIKKNDSLIKKADSQVVNTVIKKADTLIKKGVTVQQIKTVANIAKPLVKDSIPFNPADTVKTRIIKAHHNVRVYKSNMQAVADSLFYTNADSTLRWYYNPILWSQGSQQTGDTIYLRLKNKKLNTLQVIQKGFMVNVNTDSAKFNQIKGKLITAFFKEGELNTMFVDGNAESVYYNRDKDSIYTEMNQTISSRIKIFFKNKEISEILNIKDPEGIRVPITQLKEDVILTGFIWKPELRPLSKREVINGKPKVKPGAKGKTTPGKTAPAKTAPSKAADGKQIEETPEPENKIKAPVEALKNIIKKELPAQAATIDSVKVDTLIKKLVPAPVKKQ